MRKQRDLQLFKEHPVVATIYKLHDAREVFTRRAQFMDEGKIVAGEEYGADWWRDAAEDVEDKLFNLLRLISIDGEPYLDIEL